MADGSDILSHFIKDINIRLNRDNTVFNRQWLPAPNNMDRITNRASLVRRTLSVTYDFYIGLVNGIFGRDRPCGREDTAIYFFSIDANKPRDLKSVSVVLICNLKITRASTVSVLLPFKLATVHLIRTIWIVLSSSSKYKLHVNE